MVYRSPLAIHLLFHPESAEGRQLAEHLVPKFFGAPAVRGLRVSTFLTPDHGDGLPPRLEPNPQISHDPDWIDLNKAERTVVVLIADADMVSSVKNGTGAQWKDFAGELNLRRDPLRHAILLISLDTHGYELSDPRNFLTFDRESNFSNKVDEAAFQIAVRGLRLLRGSREMEQSSATWKAPVRFFLSHAKRDLGKDRKSPVHRVLEESVTMRVENWYDKKDIPIGEEFTPEIKNGIKNADLMIVFLTDCWAESVYCRMESAYAKEVGTPILVVDALKDGEPRSFPYGGNAKVIRWPTPDESIVNALLNDLSNNPSAQAAIKNRISDLQRRAAKMLLSSAVLETLTRAYNARAMQLLAEPDQVSLDVSPEAFHLATNPDKMRFLYPDPPLTEEEYAVLRSLRVGAVFETPLMRVSRALPLEKPRTVAVSISGSDVLAGSGLTQSHLTMISDEIYLYLMAAGLRIAYGGILDAGSVSDPNNFTARLIAVAKGYRGLSTRFKANNKPIVNIVPWPAWTNYDKELLHTFFTNDAEYVEVGCPEVLLGDSELKPLSDGLFTPDTIPHRFAWGLGLTEMREKMASESDARIVLGGKIENYAGRCAGLIEESLLSLRARKPLYLIGALGGCSRLIIDILEQRERNEMSTTVARLRVDQYEALTEFYAKYGTTLIAREEIAAEIRGYGMDGPAKALVNGLDDEENRELFTCIDSRRIAELILTGLSKVLHF